MRQTTPALKWEFGQVPQIPFDAPRANDMTAVKLWRTAAAPGNVRLDLLAHGLIPDPFDHEQTEASAWVDGADWWYKTRVALPLQPGQRAFVRFHGIDYLSAIFVNGAEVSRHAGMFSRQTVELTDWLQDGACELAVRLWGSNALPQRRLTALQTLWQRLASPVYGGWAGIYPHRSAALKTQMSFGWDFAPRILTTGIWDRVETIITGPTFIEDCRVAVAPSGQGKAILSLNSRTPQPETVQLTVTVPDGSRFKVQSSTSNLKPETLNLKLEFTVPEPQLWQPWDLGEPHLYTLTAEISGSDSVATRFGIRSVELRDWQFQLNGQPEFIRGLNWVPADSFPGRVSRADYAELLKLAKESGANMLRVWGGGLREKQDFYDLCDELGLLVWQEFPFACMFLGTFPRDRTFLAQVEQESTEIVRQINNHPSVVAWCGGNEFSPRRNKALIRTLARSIENTDIGSRPFIPASPSKGDSHNWDVWHGEMPFWAYRREPARFLSEFGLQALPNRQTLTTMLADPTQNWESCNGDTPKLMRYLRLFLPQAKRESPDPDDLDELIEASQRAQAAALQTAIEHMRRRKAQTGGVMVWQFNEPWPAISWAVVDYFRRPKLAYHLLKKWFNPLLISLDFEPGLRRQAGDLFKAAMWGINDSPEEKEGEILVELDGAVIFKQKTTLRPCSAVRVGDISHRLQQEPERISVLWVEDGHTAARNSYDLTWVDTTPVNRWLRLRRWVADWVLH